MSRRSIIVAVCVVLALSAVAGPATAGERSGTETIPGMEPFSISFENAGSGEMKVSWNVQVTDGVPVNVVLLDEENHGKFTDYLRYEAYRGHQYNYTNSSRRTVNVEEGRYYLAIESAHSSMETSTVDYEVKWDEGVSESDWAPWCWPVIILLVIVFGVGILFYIWIWIRIRRSAPKPATPGGGGGDTAVQLGPRPEPPDMPGIGGEAAPGSGGEPPAPGTGGLHGPDTTATQLSPQPEPPDMPAATETVRPAGEGATELSPQPEPPDHPAGHRKPPTAGG